MRARVRIGLLVGCVLGVLGFAPTAALALSLQPIGDFDQPIFVTSPPGDPRLFVVERPGYIQVLHDGVTSQFLDIHVRTTTDGERGLLSMAFDPNYTTNGLFYVFYTGDGTDSGGSLGDIHIDEFHVSPDPNVADPASRRTVMTIPHSSASNHNGGQLQFGKDGLLYISVGEAGNGANAQSFGNALGKILRIDPHGVGEGAHGVPADNPFTGLPTPEIWSLGLRNPFRFSFDHATGDIAIGDVGAGSREEIDFMPAAAGLGRGANYGWPDCEGFSGYPASCPGTVAPVLDYSHSAPCNAVVGGYVYRGSRAPEIAGRYLYTDLCHPGLRSVNLVNPLATDDRSEGVTLPSSPYSFGEDANCDLYIAAGSGSVERIVGSAAGTAPACAGSGSAASTGQRAATLRRCKRKHKKALKAKRAHDALTKSVKRRLKKKLKKCQRQARRLPL